jgi:hypothetical protein
MLPPIFIPEAEFRSDPTRYIEMANMSQRVAVFDEDDRIVISMGGVVIGSDEVVPTGCATCEFATRRFNGGRGATTCKRLGETIVAYGNDLPETRPQVCPFPDVCP